MKQKNRSHILFRLRKSFLQFKQQVSKHVLKQISKQVLSRFKLSKLLFRICDKLPQLCLVSYRRTAPPFIFFKNSNSRNRLGLAFPNFVAG